MVDADRVIEWMERLDYECREQAAPEEIRWAYEAVSEARDIHLNLVCTEDLPDRLAIARGISIADRHKPRLQQLAEDAYNEFKFSLLRDLLLRQVVYRLQHDDDGNLASLAIVRTIWEEDLDQGSLNDTVQSVVDGGELVGIHVRKIVGETP